MPEKDRGVWFTSWYEDFDDAEADHNGRYMNSPILKRVAYTPTAEDTRMMALILDRTTKLKVTKTVEGVARSDKAYAFSLAFTNLPTEEEVHAERIAADGQATALTILASNSTPYTWSMNKDESLVVDDLPPGTEFEVKETDKAEADITELVLTNVEDGTVAGETASGKTRTTWQGSAEATMLSQVDVMNAYRYPFSFKKVWEGAPLESVRFTAYGPDDIVISVSFSDPTKISDTEWQYETWFGEPAAYYVIEDGITGYTARYENTGEHADVTDRGYDRGTIINKKEEPTPTPTVLPTATPTVSPTATPTVSPTATPTVSPTATPTVSPTAKPTVSPTVTPTVSPTAKPTVTPTRKPNEYYFSFKKIWKGEPQDKISYAVYAPDGSVKNHDFRGPKKLSDSEWLYEAWFAEPVAYYVVEDAMPGYTTRYQNVGEHADVTDRVYNGGTIINSSIPKTGDNNRVEIWLALAAVSLMGVHAVLRASQKRKKRNLS